MNWIGLDEEIGYAGIVRRRRGISRPSLRGMPGPLLRSVGIGCETPPPLRFH